MSKDRLLHYLICGLIISYWFNVTIIETGIFGGVNEFKLYDILGLPFLLLTFSNYPLRRLFKQDLISKRLYYFLLWCSLTAIFTIIYSLINQRLEYVGMTTIYLYHFWIFFVSGVIIFNSEREDRIVYVQIFIIMAFMQSVIIWLQVSGVIGHLIKYNYTDEMYTGIVGPNRIVPGLMCNMGGLLSLFVLTWSNLRKSLRFPIKVIAGINILIWLPTLIMTTSRTSMLFFAIMFFVWIVVFARKYILAIFVLIPLMIAVYPKINEGARQRIEDTISYNQGKFIKASSNDPESAMDYYYVMGNGRYQIMNKALKFLGQNPYVLVVGKGFNNRSKSLKQYGALSPHNMYLNMLLEGGILGFMLYFGWLWAILRAFYSFSKLSNNKNAAGLFVSFMIAMFISLFGGEHLYVYRSHYALMGAFLVIISLGLTFLKDIEEQEEPIEHTLGKA